MSPTPPPLGLLLWPRWRAIANARRARDAQGRGRLLLFAVLGAAFMVGGFLGARWLFFKFGQVEFLAELLIRRVLTIVLLFFSGLLIFSSLIAAFSTFYLADDLPLLATSPISARRLYVARLLETWAQASWMMLVFALPIAAGCGPVLDAPPWFYALLLGLMVPLTLLCAALGSAGAMILARLLPARRTQDVLLVLALLAFLTLYVAFRLAEPERLLEPEGFDRLLGLIAQLKGAATLFTPADWYVAALFGALRGQEGLLPGLVLCAAAPSAVWLGGLLADALYLSSYSRAQEGRADDTAGADTSRAARLAGLLLRPRGKASARIPADPVAALRGRDTRIFLRTTSQWTQLLMIAALVLVYVFNFKHFRTFLEAGQVGPVFMAGLNFLLSTFVVATLAARFLYPAVSLEGRAYWLVAAAPVTARELLRAKLRWGLLPLLGLSTALSLGSGLLSGTGPAVAVAVSACAGLSTWTLAGLAVGQGAAEPQFHESNPARIASSLGGVLFMLLAMAYLVAILLLLVGPALAAELYFRADYVPRPARLALYGGLVLVAGVLSVAVHVGAMRRGARRLERRE